MAELSIEQKAEAYDKALERAKILLKTIGNATLGNLVLKNEFENMFPSLKKSEDEKMREMAIKAVYAPEAQSCIKSWGINPDDVVAWLKKQGQQDMIPLDKVIKFLDEQLVNDKDEVTGEPFINFQNYGAFKETFISFFKRKMLEKQGEKIIDCSQNHKDMNNPNGCIVLEDFNGGDGFYKVHLDYLNKKQVEEVEEMVRAWNKESNTSDDNIKSCIGICLTDADEQRFNDFGTNLKECLDWLEKQGEQKVSVDDFKAKDWYVSKVDGKIHNIYHSVTKVKPKFKVGDWVVSPNGVYWHIDSVGERYIVSSTDGISADWPLDTKLYHPFTIQDAKDGDVLVSNDDSYIVLFKGLSSLEDNIDRFKSYCHYYRNILSPIEDPSWCCNAFHPATKEQRELLFQKMHEAGYEWDAEKKELKKIEQKHFYELDNSYTRVTFPFKAKVKSSGAIVTIHNGQLSPDGKEWIEYQSDAEDRYKVYKPNNLELVCEIEQKPAFEKK